MERGEREKYDTLHVVRFMKQSETYPSVTAVTFFFCAREERRPMKVSSSQR